MSTATLNRAPACPACGGEGGLLGTLGLLRWFRCRACGMEFSRKVRRKATPVVKKPRARVRWMRYKGAKHDATQLFARYTKNLTARIWDRHGPVDAPGAYQLDYVVLYKGRWVSKGNAGTLDRAKQYAEEALLEAAKTHGRNPWSDVEMLKMLRQALSKKGSAEIERARLAEYAARTTGTYRKPVRKKPTPKNPRKQSETDKLMRERGFKFKMRPLGASRAFYFKTASEYEKFRAKLRETGGMMRNPELVEYRLGSSPVVYAPGLVRWAKVGYRTTKGRQQERFVNVIAGTWHLPKAIARGVLSEKYPAHEGAHEALVFRAPRFKPIKNPIVKAGSKTYRMGSPLVIQPYVGGELRVFHETYGGKLGGTGGAKEVGVQDMVGLARNPLTRHEARIAMSGATESAKLARWHAPGGTLRSFMAGRATGKASLIRQFGPRQYKGKAQRVEKYASALKNRTLDTAWTGRKADYVSPPGDYGPAPHSELAMHTGAAGARIVQYALWGGGKGESRFHVRWAHILTSTGQVLDGLPGEVLPAEVRRALGGFGGEKVPRTIRQKQKLGRLGSLQNRAFLGRTGRFCVYCKKGKRTVKVGCSPSLKLARLGLEKAVRSGCPVSWIEEKGRPGYFLNYRTGRWTTFAR